MCDRERCWNEMLLPFLPTFEGDERGYGTAVGLTCLLFLIGLYMMSKPWFKEINE